MSTSVAMVQSVAAYVPPWLVRQILAGSLPVPGETISLEAAVLFADISGFTPMAEALARVGRRGAEEMTQNLNDTFSATIARIIAYGGEVAAFGGDAILAFFERQAGQTPQEIAWRALTCALEMRRAMEPFARIETSGGPFSLRMKFGLSFGRIIIVNVGSPAYGLEFIIAGTPVDRSASNENYAKSEQVVADASILSLVDDRIITESVTSVASSPHSPGGKAAQGIERVLSVKPAPPWARPPIDYKSLDDEQRRSILEVVAAYLPPKLYEDISSKGSFAGDHRPVTSLFVNFAGLDYDNDPDVGTKLQTYITQAQEIIHRYDGNLNRVLTGDKGSQIHILLGAPVAHEDDKARALRCALALQRELGGPSFIQAQRIGLASGYVFAGPVGSLERQRKAVSGGWLPVTRGEYTVMGDIVNLSARLTGVCPPGQVLVDAYTRSRTAQRFEFQPLGPVKLKGKAEPASPYLIKGERPNENALVTRYLLSQRPVVGRRKEIAIIQQAITDALVGQGRVLAITGTTGVGKSRLIEEAVRRWIQVHGAGYGGDCLSHGAEIPYLPWVDLWRAQFELHENDTPQQRQAKILRFGENLELDLSEWAALVASLLGLPSSIEEHPALAPLDPQARHLRLLELTVDLIAAQSLHRPTLLVFEDLHWADRASLELIDCVAERIADLPAMICLAYRSSDGISLKCLERAPYTPLNLGELSKEEECTLIRSLLGDVDLPAAFLCLVNAKTQGNPLFVEELINGLKDDGLIWQEGEAYRVVENLDQVEVPDTIEAVLLARMDRLAAPLRDLLRVASVIGRQFAHSVLRGIYPYTMSEAEMLDRLTNLEQLDLTRLERPEPELEYLFKHNLTQEVAYENLSFASRRELHERIGRFLEQHYSDQLERFYGTLAHHFARGGQPAQALSYALAAGAQAGSLFANKEALAYYRQAENLLAQLPAQEYEEEAVRLYTSRGELHTLLGNFDQAGADLERGLALAQEVGEDCRAQARALNGLAYLRWWQTRNEEMLHLAQRALALAEAEHHQREMMRALRYIANALLELEKHEKALEFFLRARALAEALGDRHALSVVHMNIAVAAFNQGRLREALHAMQELLDIYHESGDKHRTSACLSNIANTQYYLGDFVTAHAAFKQSIAIDREIGKRAGLAYSLCDSGALHCHQGDYSAGLAAMEEAVMIFEEIGDESGRAYCDLALGREYYLDAGLYDQAETLLRRALPVLEAGESHEQMAEALLALGRLYLEQGDKDQPQVSLDRALELCQNYDLRWRLPEATVRLAELALAQGDTNRAADRAGQTLDAIAAGGCPDLRPAAYLVLARIADDPLGHYELAVSAAHQRSRCIDLARTLAKVGRYLQDRGQHPPNRVEAELQAQGHAYLQEAQALVEGMSLPSDASGFGQIGGRAKSTAS